MNVDDEVVSERLDGALELGERVVFDAFEPDFGPKHELPRVWSDESFRSQLADADTTVGDDVRHLVDDPWTIDSRQLQLPTRSGDRRGLSVAAGVDEDREPGLLERFE